MFFFSDDTFWNLSQVVRAVVVSGNKIKLFFIDGTTHSFVDTEAARLREALKGVR
jgi:hypothetical protein